jgi:hypothetical protein
MVRRQHEPQLNSSADCTRYNDRVTWSRFVYIALLVGCAGFGGCAGCGNKESAPPPPPPAVSPSSSPSISPIDAATITSPEAPVAIDAAPVIVEGEYATTTDRFLRAYLDLLWTHLSFNEVLLRYPGVPTSGRYFSSRFEWRVPDDEANAMEAVLKRAQLAAEKAPGSGATERTIIAYTTEAQRVFPRVRALAAYYRDKRFVDDEFAFGRSEAPFIAEVIATLEPLRKPMIDAVFAGWSAAAGDQRESPRAVIGISFETCMRAGNLIYGQDPNAKPEPKQAAAIERAIDDALGACRRGVGAVSALPETYRAFQAPLRKAAIAFGDTAVYAWNRKFTDDDVRILVKAYVEQWPKLPAEPAEKPQEAR